MKKKILFTSIFSIIAAVVVGMTIRYHALSLAGGGSSDSSGTWSSVTAGKVLTGNGLNQPPSWQAGGGGGSAKMFFTGGINTNLVSSTGEYCSLTPGAYSGMSNRISSYQGSKYGTATIFSDSGTLKNWNIHHFNASTGHTDTLQLYYSLDSGNTFQASTLSIVSGVSGQHVCSDAVHSLSIVPDEEVAIYWTSGSTGTVFAYFNTAIEFDPK